MIGNLISAGASLIGGLFNRSSADKANAQNMQIAQQNMEMQEEFAREGLSWKVADAKRSGIHPVYALGAPTTSFSPVSFSASADDSMGNAISKMGQDIGSAITNRSTSTQRAASTQLALEKLTLQRGALENELLASRIAKEKMSTPPVPEIGPFAVPADSKAGERPPLMAGGRRIATNPNTSNTDDASKRYGDEGPISEYIWPAIVAWNDAKMNVPSIVKEAMEGAENPWNLNPARLGQLTGRMVYDRFQRWRGRR